MPHPTRAAHTLATFSLYALFFDAQDSARLCLFCESVLSLCVLQADPALNPAAHLAGVTVPGGEGGGVSGKGATTAGGPALRLRLRRLLAACLDYAERDMNKVCVQSGCTEPSVCEEGWLGSGCLEACRRSCDFFWRIAAL